MDATQALKDTETALRDFIALTLERALGPEWLDHCGATAERIAKWRERKAAEHFRQEAGVVDERLLYYADFYDLKTILKKHWNHFAPALGELRRFEVLFDELARYRDPDAHRRELLPHQQSLIMGIAGDIRTRLIRSRSSLETVDDCFPRIESARDNLGNQWTPTANSDRCAMLPTNTVLRPGDVIDFVITASDPDDLPLEYSILIGAIGGRVEWQSTNTFSVAIEEAHVRSVFMITLSIRSPRSYHASGDVDHFIVFTYRVLPPRRVS